VLWKTVGTGDKFGYPSPAYADGVIYAGGLGDKGQVYAVSAASGEILWTATTGAGIYDSGVAVGPGYLAIGSVSGLLSIVELAGGKIRTQRQLPAGHFLSTCTVDGRRVYAATFNDHLAAFEV
jgi:outer membrane protein assembly factor BamB